MFNKTPSKIDRSPLSIIRTPVQLKKKLLFTPLGKSPNESTNLKNDGFMEFQSAKKNKENLFKSHQKKKEVIE